MARARSSERAPRARPTAHDRRCSRPAGPRQSGAGPSVARPLAAPPAARCGRTRAAPTGPGSTIADRMRDVEEQAEAVLGGLPGYVWDGERLPVPVEDIADSG